jgi:cytochrome oxidase Cu insertion factor (SCO1/SenC/PrrC family)
MNSRPVLVLLLAIAAFGSGCRHESSLPKLFPVPAVTLVSDRGRSVNLAQMKGYVTVYDFIFTNCSGTCPLMSSSMRALTRKVDRSAPVRFVSISVDPARDTPEVLRKYALRLRADDRWIFATGRRDDIVKLSVEGFKLATGAGLPGAEALLHSSKFVIADSNGVIREYCGATSPDAVDHVAKSVKDLVRERG